MPAQDSPAAPDAPVQSAESPPEQSRSRRAETPWWRPSDPRRAATAGFSAFLVGYVLTGIAFAVQMQSVSRGGSGSGGFVSTVIDRAVGVGGRQVVASSGGELALALRSVGWTFFSAQQIPLFGTAQGLGMSASGTVDVLSIARQAVEIPLTPPLYYLIPPVCLVGAGWWLVRSSPLPSSETAAAAGAQVVVGYLPTVVVATLLLAFSANVNLVVASATITAEPVLVRALVFGSGYAVVFGALGGVLAGKLQQE